MWSPSSFCIHFWQIRRTWESLSWAWALQVIFSVQLCVGAILFSIPFEGHLFVSLVLFPLTFFSVIDTQITVCCTVALAISLPGEHFDRSWAYSSITRSDQLSKWHFQIFFVICVHPSVAFASYIKLLLPERWDRLGFIPFFVLPIFSRAFWASFFYFSITIYRLSLFMSFCAS